MNNSIPPTGPRPGTRETPASSLHPSRPARAYTGSYLNTHPGTTNYPANQFPPMPAPTSGSAPRKEINPLGIAALIMIALQFILQVINAIFMQGEGVFLTIISGIGALVTLGLTVSAFFMKGKEKISATIALVLGIAASVLPLVLMIVFIMLIMSAAGAL